MRSKRTTALQLWRRQQQVVDLLVSRRATRGAVLVLLALQALSFGLFWYLQTVEIYGFPAGSMQL